MCFLSCASRHARVKGRSYDHPLLIKPDMQISRIRLSFGIVPLQEMDSSVDASVGLGLPAIIPPSSSNSPDGVFTYSFQWLTFLVFSISD